MSNLIINISFGAWHFQILRDRPWVRVSWNMYQTADRRAERGKPWLQIHQAPWLG